MSIKIGRIYLNGIFKFIIRLRLLCLFYTARRQVLQKKNASVFERHFKIDFKNCNNNVEIFHSSKMFVLIIILFKGSNLEDLHFVLFDDTHTHFNSICTRRSER